MTLYELAFACWVYGNVLDFDRTYRAFVEAVGGAPDVANPKHRHALLKWLNDWGCRQFARRYHCRASEEMQSWHGDFEHLLPPSQKHLWELGDGEVSAAVEAYGGLCTRVASLRAGQVRVAFGPAGAAKLLFALRPRSLPPWDAAIQKELGYDGSQGSYRGYLQHVTEALLSLGALCEREGFTLHELPAILGREVSTPLKLIDEYYWVTVTRGCEPPAAEVLERWSEWSSLPPEADNATAT